MTAIVEDEDSGTTYCVKTPYPPAPQTRIPLGEPITCESCDPNGRRTAEIEGYQLLLTDLAVLVLAEDCRLHATLPLDQHCDPRSLLVSSRSHRVYVNCNSIPKYLQVDFLEPVNFHISGPLPVDSDIATTANGTFISGNSASRQNSFDDYFSWLADGVLHVYAAFDRRLLVPGGLSPADLGVTDCQAFTAVYALHESDDGTPRLLFSCDTDDGTKFYEHFFSREDSRLLPSLTGSPMESPDREFLVIVSESRMSFAAHNTSDTRQYVSLRESFSGVIEEAHFSQPSTLILAVRGEGIVFVDVAIFFSSGGVEGVTRLPNSAVNCPAAGRCLSHGFVRGSQDHYLVIGVKGNAYEGRVYDLNCLDQPPIVIPIDSRPEAASFAISDFSDTLCATPTSPTSETPPTSETLPTSETQTSPTTDEHIIASIDGMLDA